MVKLFECLDLVIVLVVDDDGMLVGWIIIDDVVDVIMEEVEYLLMGMVGLDEDEDIFGLVWYMVCCWVLWLGINLFIVLVVLVVISLFEDILEKVVVLVVLMLIVVSMGGIVGS